MLSPALLQGSCLGVNMYLKPANTPCVYIDGRQFSDRAILAGGLKDFLVGTCGRYLTHYGLRPRANSRLRSWGRKHWSVPLSGGQATRFRPPGGFPEHGHSQVCRDQRLCLLVAKLSLLQTVAAAAGTLEEDIWPGAPPRFTHPRVAHSYHSCVCHLPRRKCNGL